MWRVLEDREEIRSAQRRLESVLAAEASPSVDCWGGYQGGKLRLRAQWCGRLGIWFATMVLPKEAVPRYWNGFGTTEPAPGEMMDITSEVNPPMGGIERRLQGTFARDLRGGLHLLHRGKIGGGRKGIGRSSFFRHFRGNMVRVLEGNDETEVALVADLDSPRAADQIAVFVKEVERIKQLVTEEGTGEAGAEAGPRTREISFTKEPTRRRAYEVSGRRQPSADHGLVVNGLAERLGSVGFKVGSDGFRDLFIPGRGGGTTILFEVETAPDLNSIYEAIGQLLYHSVDEPKRPKLVIVSPPLRKEVARRVRHLGLQHVLYRFVKSGIDFDGLDELLAGGDQE